MFVWVPSYTEGEEEDFSPRNDKNEYTPWIVRLSEESRLDEYDPMVCLVPIHARA